MKQVIVYDEGSRTLDNDQYYFCRLQQMNHDCLSCVDKVCQKCPTGELTPAISLGKNAFYRDFPWKPLNVVEARATNWKMISKKYRYSLFKTFFISYSSL